MSGSALDQLKDLMSMIDKFESDISQNFNNQQRQRPVQKQSEEQKYQQSSNENVPSFLIKSNIPMDEAFRPQLPKGHTAYSWNYSNTFTPTKSESKSASKQKQQKSKQIKAKKSQKGKQQKSKKNNKKVKSNEKEPQSTERRDKLIAIEKDVQKQWEKYKVFESDPDKSKEKFMCTFPYPYMNGYLHLGHAFTLSKAEFRAGFERLRGKNVLFPFAFHCTGMPIAAAAKKIKSEMEIFGNPPTFPDDEGDGENEKKLSSKLAAKKSKSKYQWQIMKEFDLKDDDIPRFTDPTEWLSYFPPIGMRHLKQFGLSVDWRRSFITTDINPFYNAFIEWQFTKLKKGNYIKFGNRPTIFSPAEDQPCADHDRESGETFKPQQYTLIKMKMFQNESTPFTKKNGDKLGKFYGSKPIYLVAATLRPETMYGQTNCFVLPRGKYIMVETKNNEYYICSEHSARNMAHQQFFDGDKGDFKVLCELEGWDLLGRALSAPNTSYERVYVLPLTTIKMDKGSGIVTSVPSDAPADYAALCDAKNDSDFRDKYYLTADMVVPFKVVPIIRIDEFDSNQSAVDLCKKYGVKNQNDTVKLEEIKAKVYKYGFAQGIMLCGDFKGEKVSVAKEKCQQQMVKRGQADIYWEPEDTVMSRTGSKCVVAFCDQWFLKYGIQDVVNEDSKENEWHKAVKQHIYEQLECYNPATAEQFHTTIDWLHHWACSRTFGLGTKLPWDKQWVIESLSDSTIYMAFYTIAHRLQNGLNPKSKIDPKELTPEIFDAIFCNGDVDKIKYGKTVTKELVLSLKSEFEYYYPMDLRVSGKDLIPNHLTMALYNHAAIWPNQSKTRWPQSYFTNGWALLDNEKMSKSTGNFLTVEGSIKKYGADATRFALANGGDTLEDANFETEVANKAILNLTQFESFVEETYATLDNLRKGAYNEIDQLFDNAMNCAINETQSAYEAMKYRDVLRFGYYVLKRNADYYIAHVENQPHKDLISRYIDVALLLISPICPHTTQSIWSTIHKSAKKTFICQASWPTVSAKEDPIKTKQYQSLQDISHEFRNCHSSDEKDRRRKLNKAKKGSDKRKQFENAYNGAIVCVADDYKPYHKAVLSLLAGIYDEKANCLKIEDWKAYLLKNIGVGGDDNDNDDNGGGGKKKKKKKKLTKEQQEQLRFASYLVKDIMPDRKKETFNPCLAYDEFTFLKRNQKLLFHGIDIDLKNVTFYKESDENAPNNIKSKTNVGHPAVKFVYVE